MFFIEQKYGNDGYATWYKIIEKLGSTENHYLNLNKEEEILYLAAKCRVSEIILISIINDLVKIGVFDKELWDAKIIWSQQFIESIEDAYKKRNNKCITLPGLRVLLLSLRILKHNKSELKVRGNTQSIEEKRIEEEIKEKEPLIYPFQSEKFLTIWDVLSKQKKWRKKPSSALQMNLKILSRYPEDTAIKMMEYSIAGEYQGIFEPKKNNSIDKKSNLEQTLDAARTVEKNFLNQNTNHEQPTD